MIREEKTENDDMDEMTWKERIQRAQECGVFSDEDLRLAASFTTCAVGEKLAKDHIAPFLDGIGPFLEHIGMAFYVAVQEQDVERAEYIHRIIQLYGTNGRQNAAVIELFEAPKSKAVYLKKDHYYLAAYRLLVIPPINSKNQRAK